MLPSVHAFTPTRICRCSYRPFASQPRRCTSAGLHTAHRTTAAPGWYACRKYRSLSSALRAATSGQEAALLPSSRQEAVRQAAEAVTVISRAASASKRTRKKGFSKQSNTSRLCIELPVSDDGPATQAELACELVQALGAEAPATIVFDSPEAATTAAAKLKGRTCLPLENACKRENLSSPVMIVAPNAANVNAVRQLLGIMASSAYALSVNPSWASGSLSSQQKQFVDSFDTVYCFQPLAVQILLSTKEGAVLRRVQQGGPRDPPWQVLMKLDGKDTVVFTKPSRPSATDLEVVFYNTAAATSPVNKGIQAARSFLDNLRNPKAAR